MTVLGPVLQVLGFCLFLAAFAWFARRARRHGGGHSLMAPIEEIWAPADHKTHIEVLAEADRMAPAFSPGDPPDLLHETLTRRS